MMLGVIGFLILDRLHLRLRPDEAAALTGIVLMAGAFATLLAQWGLIPLLHMSPRTAVLLGAALGDRKSTRLNPVTNAHLVCRLLLEKKKNKNNQTYTTTQQNKITSEESTYITKLDSN